MKDLRQQRQQRLAPGQVRIKRRLGRQHEDHLNGFMRVTGPRTGWMSSS